MPPAFALSQDQTLRFITTHRPKATHHQNKSPPNPNTSSYPNQNIQLNPSKDTSSKRPAKHQTRPSIMNHTAHQTQTRSCPAHHATQKATRRRQHIPSKPDSQNSMNTTDQNRMPPPQPEEHQPYPIRKTHPQSERARNLPKHKHAVKCKRRAGHREIRDREERVKGETASRRDTPKTTLRTAARHLPAPSRADTPHTVRSRPSPHMSRPHRRPAASHPV